MIISSKRLIAPDLGELSGSEEVECLDEIIARFGDAPVWYLRQLSQDQRLGARLAPKGGARG